MLRIRSIFFTNKGTLGPRETFLRLLELVTAHR